MFYRDPRLEAELVIKERERKYRKLLKHAAEPEIFVETQRERQRQKWFFYVFLPLTVLFVIALLSSIVQ